MITNSAVFANASATARFAKGSYFVVRTNTPASALFTARTIFTVFTKPVTVALFTDIFVPFTMLALFHSD